MTVSILICGSSLTIDGVPSNSNGQNCAFYYMGHGKVQSAAGLILSLLEQLCADSGDFPLSLQSFYASGPRHIESGPDDTFLGASKFLPSSPEKSAGEGPRMEQSASDVEGPILHSEHPILSDSTFEQRSIEKPKIEKSSTIEDQGQEGLTLDHYPTLEVLFNALKDVSQETTAETFIIIDGWDGCNMDFEDDFWRLFGVLKTLRWKIFITSRMPPANPDPAYCSIIHIQETDNAEDIRAFTTNETQHTLLQRFQDFRQETIQHITESSQGR